MKPLAISIGLGVLSVLAVASAWHLMLGIASSVPFIFGVVWGAGLAFFTTYTAIAMRTQRTGVQDT